ncbi:MFS transporter [Streptomyces sp. N2-109]|uniref:MFS transporter n=1 Tax=Streptomyces gossypii TaxID=2883101 RepID=A0ABT2K2W4_9ACTN|nr:MFS transporter [Streptomyces gossypii]MCT2594509.1 MFS transporter [Streptomyces gossypii]
MPPSPLRDHNFRLLFAGRSLALLGEAVIPVALAIAVLRVTDSPSALALVLACAMVPKLLLLPVGGVVADRLNARTVMLASALVRSAAQLFVGVQLLSGEPSLALIAGAEVVSGIAAAFAMPSVTPLVTGTIEEGTRQQANSLLGAAGSVARLGGPGLGGLLIWAVGPGGAFLLDGLVLALSALFFTLLKVRHVQLPKRSFRADLTEGWSEVRSRDWYWSSLIVHAVWNFTASVMMVLGPAIAIRELGGEGVWITVLQAGAVGLLLGSLLAGRVQPRRPVLAANLGGTLFALPLALLAASASAPLLIGGYALAMVGLGFLNPVWQTAVQSSIPLSAQARVTSYDWLLSLGAMPLGYALAPVAAEAWGTGVPLVACAVLVGASCLATAAVPGVRHFTLPPADVRGEKRAEETVG